ncbi:hypothetical protein [Streptomyces maremycinicus]|uniref:hypothetical protein n=1 Tax=Streptomyces maremycinicus TaxID=1679753 RepID=UPI00078703A0|nr:hypothetical protein [Streptomyces sp. NBRC 110468]
MPDLTPNKTPDPTRDTSRDTGTSPDAVPGVPVDDHRPAGDRARATKAGDAARTAEAVRAADAARSAHTARSADTAPSAEAARSARTAGPAETALPGEAGRSGEAAAPGGAALPGETVLPGERGRTTSADPRGTTRGTTAVEEQTPPGTGFETGGAARGRAAGSGRDAGPLSASEEGAPPRHREAGAADTVTGRAPTTAAAHAGPGGHGESLLPDDECDRIASRMRHAVVGFVDGPRDAVAEADRVLEELAARFTDAVDQRRRTLRGSWQPAEGGKDRSSATATATDTEQLRLALRDYRELTERLLHL